MTEALLSVRGLEIGFHTDQGLAQVLDRVNLELAEAAAEHTVYSEHREAVKKSLKSIVFY